MAEIDVLVEDARWDRLGIEDLARRAVDAALVAAGLDPSRFSVSVLACDDARIAELNATFRGKEGPTNVLSWPSAPREAAEDGEMPALPAPSEGEVEELGDIAIALETAVREAQEAGKPPADHVTHLLVHGCLHLLGFDHIRDKDAALMEAIEVRALAALGIANPYEEE